MGSWLQGCCGSCTSGGPTQLLWVSMGAGALLLQAKHPPFALIILGNQAASPLFVTEAGGQKVGPNSQRWGGWWDSFPWSSPDALCDLGQFT